MIIVNVWDAVAGSMFGHASMILPATRYAPELTISWWPTDVGLPMLSGIAATMPYHDPEGGRDELGSEGRLPEIRYSLGGIADAENGIPGGRAGIGLNEAAIHEWWREYSEDGTYRLYNRNCCTTVVAGLFAGGAEEYARLANLAWVPFYHPRMMMAPQNVRELCEAIITGMSRSRF